MKVYYGSPAHILSVLIPIFFATGAYFLLRGKSQKIKKYAVLSVMILNLLQHLFKSLIYPHHFGEGFSVVSTAYNMCALIIIISPVAFLFFRGFFLDFVLLLGSAAGIVAILVPYWHIGESPFSWEYLRYMICHVLLFVSSTLPLSLGLHKPSYRSIPFFGAAFLFSVVLILLNDAFCYLVGILRVEDGVSLGEALAGLNPVWSFGPPESFSALLRASAILSPDVWVYGGHMGGCMPVLWYCVPVYLLITLIAVPVSLILDRKRFFSDLGTYLVSTKKRKRAK